VTKPTGRVRGLDPHATYRLEGATVSQRVDQVDLEEFDWSGDVAYFDMADPDRWQACIASRRRDGECAEHLAPEACPVMRTARLTAAPNTSPPRWTTGPWWSQARGMGNAVVA